MKLSLPCSSNAVTVKFVHCSETGKNNMDHHIMTLLGYLAKNDTVKGIRIISNDSDFRNIVIEKSPNGEVRASFEYRKSAASFRVFEQPQLNSYDSYSY